MRELPPYAPTASCRKCGHALVSTQWHAQGGVWCNAHGAGSIFDPEHLARTCQRCGYAWVEAPLTVEGEQEVNDVIS